MTQPFQKVSERLSFKRIAVNNLVGGIFWALGATIGISIILGLLSFLTKNVNLVPVVGEFVSNVIDFILAKNPNLN
ncbi:MAG TPA: DUF5665 domain-containing protein [Xanthomonadales bacterium]|nr:DUF5665 domain-containing protein [Xanthomonadales bacterium]